MHAQDFQASPPSTPSTRRHWLQHGEIGSHQTCFSCSSHWFSDIASLDYLLRTSSTTTATATASPFSSSSSLASSTHFSPGPVSSGHPLHCISPLLLHIPKRPTIAALFPFCLHYCLSFITVSSIIGPTLSRSLTQCFSTSATSTHTTTTTTLVLPVFPPYHSLIAHL